MSAYRGVIARARAGAIGVLSSGFICWLAVVCPNPAVADGTDGKAVSLDDQDHSLIVQAQATDGDAAPRACQLPDGMIAAASTDAGWRFFYVSQGRWQPVDGKLHARAPAMPPSRDAIIYFDAAGQLPWRRLHASDRRVLLVGDQQYAYTQAAFGGDDHEVIAVRLLDRRSRDSDLVSVDVVSGKVVELVPERSAQLEPKQSGDTLVYSTIHCAVTCAGFVQEIWMMQRAQKLAQQLTLNHAHSRDPVIDRKNNTLYYSSNFAGGFRIYRQPLPAETTHRSTPASRFPGSPVPVASGEGLELWPAIDDRGQLWFVREGFDGSELICLDDGRAQRAALPDGATRLRELEIAL